MALLEVDDVHTYYGAIHALKGLSLSVEEGEIVTLIGGNGAGKSTTLNTICGLVPPRSGSVRRRGEDGARVHGSTSTRRWTTQWIGIVNSVATAASRSSTPMTLSTDPWYTGMRL